MEPILTSLVTGVGTATAKGALKRWLKDYPEALSSSSAVVDVLGSLTRDVIARRRGAAQFDRIAEMVAEDALEVVNAMGVELSLTQQRVVVDVAGEVLQRCVNDTEFGAELLARHNLEVGEVSHWLLKHTVPAAESPIGSVDQTSAASREDPTRGFNAGQRTLYERLLYDSAQYIVDLASQFPNFTERTVAEVLKREDLIMEMAALILSEVGRIRTQLQAESATDAAFEERYRRAVIRRLDQLQLFGVDVANTSKRYRLSIAYISLLVERERLTDLPAASDDDRETVPVEVALASTDRLFVRGPAGSGKTTLLQWVAVMAASRSTTGDVAVQNDQIPFYIKLREFADRELPTSEEFTQLIDREIGAQTPSGWTQQQLETGRALILIDGLDEMPADRREAVRTWIDGLTEEYHRSQVIVTTRPYAAEEYWLNAEGFLHAELQNMSTSDVHAFIRHWHEAVKEGVQNTEERDELSGFSTALQSKVASNRAIFRLATNPLLCAMLCALHRDRVQNLPGDRIELYRACVDMFFRRDTERRITLGDYPEIGDRQKRTLLADLAFWLIRNNLTTVDVTKADNRLERSLRSIGERVTGITGEHTRRLFVERIGILRQPEPGHIDFPHRTFQEYLAAHAAIAEGCIGELIGNAHRDQWREVIILAAGIARESDAEELVLGVIDRGDNEAEGRATFYLLAVVCRQAVVRFPKDSTIPETVNDRLQRILPPQKLSKAQELSKAGDLVVPFLGYDSKRTAAQLAACVRTLALVGGEQAYSAIAKYRRDPRITVWTEILKADKHVSDQQELARAFSEDMNSYGHTSLDFSAVQIDDVSALVQLPKLHTLKLNGTYSSRGELKDISGLRNLKSLKYLGISDTTVTDISTLAHLRNLQTLDLSSTEVNDVSALAGLSHLEELNLFGTKVHDVFVLAGLKNLRTLNLRSTRVNGVPDSLSTLQSLDLSSTEVRDASALMRLTALELLDIGSTDIKCADLSGLVNLHTLVLSDTLVSDLSSLAFLQNLHILDLSNTPVYDISPLAGLTKLKTLYLYNTEVGDVAPLANLTNLQTLYVRSIELSDLSPLDSLVEKGLTIETEW